MDAISSVDDDDFVQVGETRVVGIGYGTFTVLIFFMFIWFVWLLSEPIQSGLRWFWRFLAMFICGIGFMLMVFAERENRYDGQGIEVKVSETNT
jgi:hypothetical protein